MEKCLHQVRPATSAALGLENRNKTANKSALSRSEKTLLPST